MTLPSIQEIAASLWSQLGGADSTLDKLMLSGDRRLLPSVFDVTGLATASVGVANLAVAELHAARLGRSPDVVTVTTREASAAYRCEALFAPEGWELPPVWDPIAGDYEASDGWIRLHTNYSYHRSAVLRALDIDTAERDLVTTAVAGWTIDGLESRVVEEGGAAAAMRTQEEWNTHPQGIATSSTPPIENVMIDGSSTEELEASALPLDGVKILDLTRVIAGPFGTRFLAAWGANVLRIDPRAFEEVPAIIPEASAGKKCASLDLSSESGRRRFFELVAEADVVVHGFRPGALDELGLDHDSLHAANPNLIISQHDAYGWSGPWATRRGFDSLVQMSCGIASVRGSDRPRPLPAQALDHTIGMLIAAAVCRALTTRTIAGKVSNIRGSLIGVANLLLGLPDPDAMLIEPPSFTSEDTEARSTWWGAAQAVPIPGRIGNMRPLLSIEPGPLGRHPPSFS